MSTGTVITGSGTAFPPHVITNNELCEAFNEFVRRYNAANAAAIEAGELKALGESSGDFIEKASGIKQRHVWDKQGVLDPNRMRPIIERRADDELCQQAQLAVEGCKKALESAGRVGQDVDLIVLASANIQRPYPAVAMEVQNALGARGYSYDMNVGCSSGTFAIQAASAAVRAGTASCALVVVPELMCGHASWKDRDSHFIFGDGCAAVVIEDAKRAKKKGGWEILDTKSIVRFSNNIRNNGGYMNHCEEPPREQADILFVQQGRKVFKDIVPLASQFIRDHIESNMIDPAAVTRYWLHQANININRLIAKRVVGHDPTPEEAPVILDRYANTAGAGSMIAFHLYNEDLPSGSTGVLCSFGAGYSIGSVLLRRS